jgi:hypothetical protein
MQPFPSPDPAGAGHSRFTLDLDGEQWNHQERFPWAKGRDEKEERYGSWMPLLNRRSMRWNALRHWKAGDLLENRLPERYRVGDNPCGKKRYPPRLTAETNEAKERIRKLSFSISNKVRPSGKQILGPSSEKNQAERITARKTKLALVAAIQDEIATML